MIFIGRGPIECNGSAHSFGGVHRKLTTDVTNSMVTEPSPIAKFILRADPNASLLLIAVSLERV